jgi:intracellular septation protein
VSDSFVNSVAFCFRCNHAGEEELPAVDAEEGLLIEVVVEDVLVSLRAVLLVSKYLMGRNLMQKLLGEKVSMPDSAWGKLNLSWALFFLVAGGLNLFVAFSGLFSESQWVNFKVFGLMALLIVFVIAQSIWLGKHMQQDETKEALAAPDAKENKP